MGEKHMERALQEREEIRRKVIEHVRSWAKKIRFPATIILIGSYARGDHNFWSDVDILLIANTGKALHRRLENIDYPPNFEIIFLTPSEFKLLLKRREPIALEALLEGIIVRDDLNIRKLKEKLSE